MRSGRGKTSFVLALGLVGVMLAACGGSKSKASVSTPTTETTVTSESTTTAVTAPGETTLTTAAGAQTTTTAKAAASGGAKTTTTAKSAKTSKTSIVTVPPRAQVTAPPATAAPTEPIQPGGTLTFLVNFDGSGYDPTKLSTNSVSADTPRLFAVYDVLVYTDPVSGAVLPELASSMTTNDALVWTMKIRPNVKFSDGTVFDAAAVKFNWDRQRDPANAATGAAIVNGMTYEVVDSLTLKMTLKVANGQFPRQVADYLPYIGSPTAIAAAGSQANYLDKPVGAGPFILKQWLRDSQSTYVRNPTYWNAPRPYVDQLIIKTVLDETQRKNTMLAGGADVAFTNAPATVAEYGTNGITAYLSPSINTNIFYMNERVAALGDLRVRRALQLAIDIDQLNKLIDGGVGEVPHGYFPPNFPYSDPALVFPGPDLTQAQSLINAYVNENGGKDLTFDFITSTSPRNQNYYAAIKQMVEKLNHVHMTLRTLDAGAQLTALINHDFTIHMSAYPGTDPEPGFLERALSNGTSQYIGYSNADVDKNVALSRSTTDATVRNNAIKAIQKQMIADVPFFPLYRSPGFIAESSRVRDLATFNDGGLMSDRIWLKTH